MAAPILPQTGGRIVQLSTNKSPWSADSQDGYDEWGSITLNDTKYVCPEAGYFIVKGAERQYRWDVQNGLMLQGAIEILRGITPPEFTLEHYFWADSQWESVVGIITGLQYNLKNIIKSGATALGQLIVRGITIYHPSLDLIGINQVNIRAVGAPEQQGDDHMWKATYKLQEYFPPRQLPPQDKDTAPVPAKNALNAEQQSNATYAAQLENTAAGITITRIKL